MADKVGSIYVDIGANVKDFEQKLKSATTRLNDFGKKANQIGRNISMKVTLPIIAAGAGAIKMASDYVESLNKVDVAFGKSSGVVQKFAEDSLRSFGIAEGSALDMAALFGDMATSMGISQEQAAGMSTSLVGLAGDLSSFKNIRLDVAETALKSIFTGETESLKNLGIVMTQANLQAFAYSQGIQKNIQDMTEAEKVNLRYAYVLDKTKNAQGDFARTGGGAANQMRIFTESMKELGQTFGEIILPAFTKIITKVNGFIQMLGNLTEETRLFIIIAAGIAAVLGPLIVTVGSLSVALSGLGTVITLMTGPIGIAIAAIAALAAAFIYVADNWDAIKQRLGDGDWWRNMLVNMLKEFIKLNPFSKVIEAYNKMARVFDFAEITNPFQLLADQLDVFKAAEKSYRHEFGSFGDAIKNGLQKGLDAFGLLQKKVDEVETPDGSETSATVAVDLTPRVSGTFEQDAQNLLEGRSLDVDFSAFEQGSTTMLDLLNPVNQQIVALGEQFDILSQKAQVFGMTSEELAANQLNLVTTELDRLIESGQTGGEYFDFLTEKMRELKAEANTMPTVFEQLSEVFGNMQNQMVSGFMQIGDAFGKSAQDGQKATARIIKQLLSQAIAQYILKALSDKTLPLLPALALAAGGTAAVSAIFNNIPAFAEGGAVTSPTLAMIGEKPGSRGEAIIPFEKIPKLFDKMSGGANKMMVEVRGVLDGDVIRLVQDRAIQDNSLVR
jgi:hypothetical protein